MAVYVARKSCASEKRGNSNSMSRRPSVQPPASSPAYVIDDETAVKVAEGNWKLLQPYREAS